MTDDATRTYEPPSPETPGHGDPAGPATTATTPAAVAGSSNRLRWVLGLGTAGVILAVTAAAILLLGAPSTPEVLKYVPGDAAIVAEVRMDLPGDQLQKVGNLLAHFPGFADQSTLDTKIDEALGRLVDGATEGEADYVTDVKPWLNGPAFVGVFAPAEGTDDGAVVLAATTNGAVDCATVLEGEAQTNETVRGLDLVRFADTGLACVVDGRFALLGVESAVRAAIDAKADGTGMDRSEAYLAARGRLEGEQLGSLYVDGKRMAAAMPSPDPGLPVPGLEMFGAAAPDWLIAGVRAEDDALVLDVITAPLPQSTAAPSTLTLPPAHPSALTGAVPADSLVFVESQGAGVALQNLFATLRTIPELETPLQMLDGVARPEDLVGWVEDAGVALSNAGQDPDNPELGATVLLAAKDAATATEKATGIRTLLGFLAIGGEGVTIVESVVAGVAVTEVRIADLGAVVPPGSVPGVDELPISGELTLSIAVRDRIVYLAVGPGTMAAALNVTGATSLAEAAAFRQAAGHGLDAGQLTVYVAAGASIDLAEPFLPDDVATQWATEYAPYIDPVEAVAAWSSMDASANRSRIVITVTGP